MRTQTRCARSHDSDPGLIHPPNHLHQVTTNRALFNSQGGRKVTAAVISSATGVIQSGNTCGVAYLNSLSWARNTVWVSCNCGIHRTPQIVA